jgi:hypothetical protein
MSTFEVIALAVALLLLLGAAVVLLIGSDGEGLPNDLVDEHEQDHWEAQGKDMSKFPLKRKDEE